MANKTFTCSDESLNSHGLRILTAGIKLNRFKSNPVMFFNHDRNNSWYSQDPTYTGPIGRWENVKKVDNELKADAVFDIDDEKAAKIAGKVERDFLKAASIGIYVISTSNDPDMMLPGQSYPTITECELIEISVVDVPSNRNALALYDNNGKKIEMTEESLMLSLSALLPTPEVKPTQKQNTMKFKITSALSAIATFLGVKVEEGKEQEVEMSAEKVTELNAKLELVTSLETQVTNLNTKANDLQTKLTAAETKATDAETKLAGETKKVTDKDAEIVKLTADLDKANKTPGVELKHPVKTGKEGEEDEEEVETDPTAKEFAELRNFSFENTKLSDNPSFAKQI